MKFLESLRRAAGLVWPVECPMCGHLLMKGERSLCLDCLVKIPRYGAPREIVHNGAPGGRVVMRSWMMYTPGHVSHRLIHDFKYHDRRRLARNLGRELAEELIADNFLAYHPVDILLPIPLHPLKHISRTYNQAYEIALGLSDLLNIPVGRNLRARRHHRSQTARNSSERDANVRDIFAVRHPDLLNGRHIALVDDVITTGATMFSALRSILDMGVSPASVTFLSLANTRLD